ncbi:hypothetical protein Q9Q99_01405 [Curtobacterium flaccumfaciens]|nr:hypothetical protein Q9Q99_01405 [Curtobacterium flaccumfaciens]
MQTIRTGTDLAAVEDVVDAVAAHGERYLDRVFTVRERADTGDDPERLAARFRRQGGRGEAAPAGPGPGDPAA